MLQESRLDLYLIVFNLFWMYFYRIPNMWHHILSVTALSTPALNTKNCSCYENDEEHQSKLDNLERICASQVWESNESSSVCLHCPEHWEFSHRWRKTRSGETEIIDCIKKMKWKMEMNRLSEPIFMTLLFYNI